MSGPTPLTELIGPVVRDLAKRSGKDLTRWLDQVIRLNGCSEPIRLIGESLTVDTSTGELLTSYNTRAEPHGQLLVRCGNRRASRCPSCAEIYRRDTFHLIRAGLSGGSKGVPATVRTHPRVLATLTAPSFGAVHRGPDKNGRARVCHPRRHEPACFDRHPASDTRIGQPLDPGGYDYVGHVLWNAHAGDLWRRFTIYLRRHLAGAAGLSQAAFNRQVKVSFAKVAEYQARGVVHFHAVIRLDARTEDGTPLPPPEWATVQLLDGAIRSAAAAVRLTAPDLGQPTTDLVWGDQIDVKPIPPGELDDGDELTEQKVAGYIAKYATKAAETSGTLDRRIRSADLAWLRDQGATEHAAQLIRTAWTLGNPATHPDLLPLRLRQWAHMLGFRGHFSTRSRTYSTTLGALRQARIDYRQAQRGESAAGTGSTLVLAHWKFAGQGYTPGESALAASIRTHADSRGTPKEEQHRRSCWPGQRGDLSGEACR
ncbi:replication initiator [Acrocarpospora catenulata]|uniref:replication initiator n=1 Tax=Acrocarpospora catenulata TaxID=2836182 RepID=UPI001BDA83BF|nr:replication initiator [Acrocarpospora catenulata]